MVIAEGKKKIKKSVSISEEGDVRFFWAFWGFFGGFLVGCFVFLS